MADVGGLELTAEDREVLSHPLVGGVILFARNYTDHDQLRLLCYQLRQIKKPRLLVAVDHEGGRVQRFRVGFTRVPAMRTLGNVWLESPDKALNDAFTHGQTIAKELTSFGIDLSFSPVLDRDCGISGVIGDRAFSDQNDTLIALARAFRKGLNAGGHTATGKHFPGHGAVTADSHHELPIDRRSYEQLLATELVPFKALIDDGIESLMMAHVRYQQVDTLPASLSSKWIKGLLRKEWRYNGAVFCDDLSMGGAAVVGTMEERARLALEAGCDMLPVCNDRAATVALLDALKDVQPNKLSSARLKRLYHRPLVV